MPANRAQLRILAFKSMASVGALGVLLTLVLWAGSYWQVQYEWCDEETLSGGGIVAEHGRLIIKFGTDFNFYPPYVGLRLGFDGRFWFHNEWILPYLTSWDEDSFGVFFPLWIPLLGFGVLLVLSAVPLHTRHRRRKLGLCANCGYDLRSARGRCPECGTAFQTIRNS